MARSAYPLPNLRVIAHQRSIPTVYFCAPDYDVPSGGIRVVGFRCSWYENQSASDNCDAGLPVADAPGRESDWAAWGTRALWRLGRRDGHGKRIRHANVVFVSVGYKTLAEELSARGGLLEPLAR